MRTFQKLLYVNPGAVNQICTDDLVLTKNVLYYLSYNGKMTFRPTKTAITAK